MSCADVVRKSSLLILCWKIYLLGLYLSNLTNCYQFFYASILLLMTNCTITFSKWKSWATGKLCPQQTLTLLWQFIISKRRERRSDVNLFFYYNKTLKMVKLIAGLSLNPSPNQMRRWTAVKMNFIQIDVNIVNSFSHFLIGYLQQSITFLSVCTLIDDKN